jgi:hypothetical protein
VGETSTRFSMMQRVKCGDRASMAFEFAAESGGNQHIGRTCPSAHWGGTRLDGVGMDH